MLKIKNLVFFFLKKTKKGVPEHSIIHYSLNSCKRLIQISKFNCSIMTVTTSSTAKKTSRLLFIVKKMSILILC